MKGSLEIGSRVRATRREIARFGAMAVAFSPVMAIAGDSGSDTATGAFIFKSISALITKLMGLF
jgi:hypothetical protein